jgi:hypothetical protein
MKSMKTSRVVRCAWAAAVLLAAVGCHDILSVQNPQAFSNDAANDPTLLPAVAAGAEGDVQVSIAALATMTGMLSDEMWHTGTWSDWLDVSKGVIRKNWPFDGAFSGREDNMLRARGTAESASRRFENVLKDTAHVSPLFITSEMARAWADLELAMSVCQAPATAGGVMVSDTALFKQAADSFTALIPLIQNAHYTSASDRQNRLNQARGGLARADLMLGNYDAALSMAQQVPAGFEYDAVYSNNSDFQNNAMADQGNSNHNRSFSIRASVWQQWIDTVNFALLDPYSGKPDQRVQLGHDNNNAHGYARGSDGVTVFYSIGKYPSYASPIVMTSSQEMNLIIAEVSWRKGDNAGAVAAMNLNRRLPSVALPDLAVPTSGDVSTQIRDMILQERFATMFAEGTRMQDLYRFNLVTARLGPGRATKLPLSRTEQLTNPHIGEGKETCPAVS